MKGGFFKIFFSIFFCFLHLSFTSGLLLSDNRLFDTRKKLMFWCHCKIHSEGEFDFFSNYLIFFLFRSIQISFRFIFYFYELAASFLKYSIFVIYLVSVSKQLSSIEWIPLLNTNSNVLSLTMISDGMVKSVEWLRTNKYQRKMLYKY